ncbi:MAG TPA: hypothetical protein VFF64_21165 [Candidatus Eremiobacteraceae bacterium]|nr:hypothetical protein [Candidatus Eremiobacteraceae bacterium]
MPTNGSWKDLYAGAMLERNPSCLANKIKAAEETLRQAMEELPDEVGAVEEMRTMTGVMRNLQALQRLELPAAAPARLRVPNRGE